MGGIRSIFRKFTPWKRQNWVAGRCLVSAHPSALRSYTGEAKPSKQGNTDRRPRLERRYTGIRFA